MHSSTVLPLHGGHAPKWLFPRMVRLGRAISLVIMDEFGSEELLRRLADPNWFQALACAIGYDWHSSGTTTVTIGALKEALNETGEIFIAGGKGKQGTDTPNQITKGVDELSIPGGDGEFRELSRLSAKIDAGLVYENIGIYHHSFIFTKSRKWAVVQQAMDNKNDNAIRFQWHSDLVDHSDIAMEPHTAVAAEMHTNSLDLTSRGNTWVRESGVEALEEMVRMVKNGYPDRHKIIPSIDLSKRGRESIIRAGEIDPEDYRELLLIKGVGRATIRSLALVSSLIYDKELAYRDPVTYAYNLGGKDRIPFPIDKRTYDSVIESMNHVIDGANIGREEKYSALRRLNRQVQLQQV